MSSLADFVSVNAARYGDRTALVHGDRSYGYAELARHTGALAAAMRRDGLTENRVAFLLPNTPETVLTYLACFAVGAMAVPLNYRYAPAELEAALRRARPKWFIVHAEKLDVLDEVADDVLDGVRVLVVGSSERFESFSDVFGEGSVPRPRHAANRPAVMFFTSGSTGQPKGVVHGHRSAFAMLTSTSEALGNVRPDDVVLVCEPQVHVSGFIATLTTLISGGTVVLLAGFEPTRYIAELRRRRPTLVCTHIDILARLVRAEGARRDWFSSLRGVYTGGDTLPAPLQREFMGLTGMPIGVGWGMTEAIWLTVTRTARLERDGCIGQPVDGAEIRRDEETGELLVRGPMLMLGYWDDDELTRACMSDGWFRTGDLGSRDAEGVWWFEGRIKDLIVRRTSKITPGEVESAIERHPAVAMAAVIAASDEREGQVPVAFVVIRDGSELSTTELLSFLRERIAAYKLPARIHYVGSLPLTPSGKIAHRELAEPSVPASATSG